ncbi:hypothetical protein GCM10023222_32930 [Saccharopolyspora cebuensis]
MPSDCRVPLCRIKGAPPSAAPVRDTRGIRLRLAPTVPRAAPDAPAKQAPEVDHDRAATMRNTGESPSRLLKAVQGTADHREGPRTGRHVYDMEATTMNETYTAPQLTEVGDFTADTLGRGGTVYDSLITTYRA